MLWLSTKYSSQFMRCNSSKTSKWKCKLPTQKVSCRASMQLALSSSCCSRTMRLVTHRAEIVRPCKHTTDVAGQSPYLHPYLHRLLLSSLPAWLMLRPGWARADYASIRQRQWWSYLTLVDYKFKMSRWPPETASYRRVQPIEPADHWPSGDTGTFNCMH